MVNVNVTLCYLGFWFLQHLACRSSHQTMKLPRMDQPIRTSWDTSWCEFKTPLVVIFWPWYVYWIVFYVHRLKICKKDARKIFYELLFRSKVGLSDVLVVFLFVLQLMGKHAFWTRQGFMAAVPQVATVKKKRCTNTLTVWYLVLVR